MPMDGLYKDRFALEMYEYTYVLCWGNAGVVIKDAVSKVGDGLGLPICW
jgi:hypothetical protein